MYVEEVCIDGFKSYAQRTVVPQFDQYFNAITGLNGSGKSNILDSICFVLGITNLSQVRFIVVVYHVAAAFFFVVLVVFSFIGGVRLRGFIAEYDDALDHTNVSKVSFVPLL